MPTPEYELLMQNGHPDTPQTSAIKNKIATDRAFAASLKTRKTLSVSVRSRMKRAYPTTLDGKISFSPMPIIEQFYAGSSDWTVHTVQAHEVGFLDKIAYKYYGAGSEDLWWVIGYANEIIYPDLEMTAGQRLQIPSYDAVLSFIGVRPDTDPTVKRE